MYKLILLVLFSIIISVIGYITYSSRELPEAISQQTAPLKNVEETLIIKEKPAQSSTKNDEKLAQSSDLMLGKNHYDKGLEHAISAIEINPEIPWYHALAVFNAYYSQENTLAIKYARSYMSFNRDSLKEDNYRKVGRILAELTSTIDPLVSKHATKVYKASKETFLKSLQYYEEGEFNLAKSVIDELWQTYPIGDSKWGSLKNRIPGENVGNPPYYAAIRVIDDIVTWKISNKLKPSEDEITLKVVLIGNSEGVQPNSWLEFEGLTGEKVKKKLHPQILENDNHIVRESLNIFVEYLHMISKGKLRVKLEFLHLPDLTAKFSLEGHKIWNGQRIKYSLENWSEIRKSIPHKDELTTDLWWYIYPTLIPESNSTFENPQFVQAGITYGKNKEPIFLEDDISLINKRSNKAGGAAFTDLGRKSYITLFLQHEFFHYLFLWAYPEFGLEKKSHQWHFRETWPEDFEGRYEADYYNEAMKKRIINAKPPLDIKLRNSRGQPDVFKQLSHKNIIGDYHHTPKKNDWHTGRIEIKNNEYFWVNKAGISWKLVPDWDSGLLRIDKKSPYNEKFSDSGSFFKMVLLRDETGAFLNEIKGYWFNSRFYLRKK